MEDKKKIQIFAHQEEAFNKLCDVARACFAIQRKSLPFMPRTNTLIIGPSGSGKTYLASAVASETGAPFLSLSISEWVLIACSTRGGVSTWPAIVQFLLTNQKAEGIVIFLDELDKLSGASTWEAFERTEIFKLLDLAVPSGLADLDNDPVSDEDHQTAKSVLANRTMIIGAGAFQDLWDSPQKSCAGFGNTSNPATSITLNQLSKTLPRELINRFRSEVLILPQLVFRDYEEMLLRAAESIPSYLQKTFLDLGPGRIQKALEARQGCRFIEELLLDTILLEREAMRILHPPDQALASNKSAILKAFRAFAL
jgi:SpoVK/Ycf46/Vps4 family AAA+-type ATPase